MNNSKKTRKALLSSIVALMLCFSMFVGTTMAWFTDTATTSVNTIQAGTLDIDMVDANGTTLVGKTLEFKNKEGNTNILWEPGVTFVTDSFKVVNNGNLALKFMFAINGIDGDAELLDAITFTVVDGNGNLVATENEVKLGVEETKGPYKIQGHMDELAGNQYQGLSLTGIAITVNATQDTVEVDSKDNQYDKDATYDNKAYTFTTAPVDATGVLTVPADEPVVLKDNGVTATIKNGTKTKTTGATEAKMELVVEKTDDISEEIVFTVGEEVVAYNVEVTNIDKDNNTEIIEVVLDGEYKLPAGLTGVKAYNKGEALSVSDGSTVGFKYDAATGIVTLYVKHFCDFTFVYDVATVEDAPKAEVSKMDASELAVSGYKYDGGLTEADMVLDFGYVFKATETVEQIKGTKYEYWIADFYVSANKDVKAGEIYLAGNYNSDAVSLGDDWIAITGDVKADTEFALLDAFGFGDAVRYKDVCGFYDGFKCGAFVEGTSKDTTITVKLVLTNPENASEQILIKTCTETI